MTSYNKSIGSGAGGTLGTGLAVVSIWLMTDPQFLGLSMPDTVQVAIAGIITTIAGIAGTYLAPHNAPPSP